MRTYREIVQTLELCSSSSCDDCYYCNTGIPCLNLYRQARDLINRQQAEIEKLQNDLNIWKDIAYRETSYVEKARVAAVKEFTERLVTEKYYTGNPTGYGTYAVMVDTINKIAEKMIGDSK